MFLLKITAIAVKIYILLTALQLFTLEVSRFAVDAEGSLHNHAIPQYS